MLTLPCGTDEEKNKRRLKVEIIFVAILLPVVLMAIGFYVHKTYTGFFQTLGTAMIVIGFFVFFFSLLGWGLYKMIREDSKEFQEEDDEK